MSRALAHRIGALGGATVWGEFGALAAETGACNLGQGFPNWATPPFVKEAMKRAVDDDFNQYTRSQGHVPLVQALATRYATKLGRDVDAMEEVAVTVGASQALFSSLMSRVNPGDHVLVLEPAFDIYLGQIAMAGATVNTVPLRQRRKTSGGDGEQEWYLDIAELRAAMTPQTRAFILNTPHNPTGKVFSAAELGEIADVVKEQEDTVVIADEVYEHMVYDGASHTHIASLPDMYDRTMTISSAGKTFSVTGWKIGWVVGPRDLVKGVTMLNAYNQFSVSTPSQQAVAAALDRADEPYEGAPNYYAWLVSEYSRKRKVLGDALTAAGLTPCMPEGGFFILASTASVTVPPEELEVSTEACPKMTRDWAFCRWSTKAKGVVAIPLAPFAVEANRPMYADLARFAFCKTDEELEKAAKLLVDGFGGEGGESSGAGAGAT